MARGRSFHGANPVQRLIRRFAASGRVTIDGTTRSFRARVAEGEERARIWEQGLLVYPGWSQYERRASHRRIAVFVLD